MEWVIGMQSRNGGWGAFDADNTHYYLNHIPFADHGALLDPPTVDVTARCLSFLAQLGHARRSPAVARGLAYLQREQEADGSWFGRWGTNYIYGTWSALCAAQRLRRGPCQPLHPQGGRLAEDAPARRRRLGRGRRHLLAGAPRPTTVASTPSQTAWALLGLMAAGEVESDAVRRGIDYLMRAPRDGANWEENCTRRSASRASSTSATTATAPISRSGRWPATAT